VSVPATVSGVIVWVRGGRLLDRSRDGARYPVIDTLGWQTTRGVDVGGLDGIEEFRFALVAGGRSRDGRPDGNRAGPSVQWEHLRFLRSGATVLRNRSVAGPDLLDPAQPAAVPCGYRTDGTWIWPDAMGYYLDRHAVAIPTELEQAAREVNHYHRGVTGARLGLAREALWRRSPGPFEPVSPPQTRFPRQVFDVLVTYGWEPGRDIAVTVDAWRDQFDLSMHDPSAALVARATTILREFGGLRFPIFGPGRDRPVVAFELYPAKDAPNMLRLWSAHNRNSTPLFPLGSVYDWGAELVVDEAGRILAYGDDDYYLGATIDEALTSLVRGVTPGP
jgi:SUKH-3 immunity protein